MKPDRETSDCTGKASMVVPNGQRQVFANFKQAQQTRQELALDPGGTGQPFRQKSKPSVKETTEK
jgi:hypothetical protein